MARKDQGSDSKDADPGGSSGHAQAEVDRPKLADTGAVQTPFGAERAKDEEREAERAKAEEQERENKRHAEEAARAKAEEEREAERRAREAARAKAEKKKNSDFDDNDVSGKWDEILERDRKSFGIDVFRISPPRGRLDPIAEEARTILHPVLVEKDKTNLEEALKNADGLKRALVEESDDERKLREKIVELGLSAAVKKVTDRLNSRYMTDGRRAALSATYVYVLDKLFSGKKGEELKKLLRDDLGVASNVLLELEAKDGPLDVYARLMVDAVMKRNFIEKSPTVKRVVAQRLRAAI